MSQLELLRFVAGLLGKLGVPWMIVGSHASSFYGEARSTHDIDLVVDLDASKIPALIAAVPSDRFYLSEQALREGRMANLIDTMTGDKVDLFLVAGDESIGAELSRRQPAKVLGIDAYIASVEDTVVAKLRWHRQLGGSERQIRDVRGILANQRSRIDFDVLHKRIEEENLGRLWNEEIAPWLDENS